jgi:8-oxo-dGTP pyrophosphatase MutT (NUDIX family)
VTDVVRAAGGVVVREASAGVEVLLVHRPKYDDWTFPKGKAEQDESDEDCARREVEEETGLVCELRGELEPSSYRDAQGRPKHVRYWVMTPVAGELAFRHEVDDGRWLGLEVARRSLSYERDVRVLDSLSLAT